MWTKLADLTEFEREESDSSDLSSIVLTCVLPVMLLLYVLFSTLSILNYLCSVLTNISVHHKKNAGQQQTFYPRHQ